MKIIKTHSNINKLQLEGLYEAKLPFTNLLGLAIDAVIIEDIIPLSFLHFIEEPKNLLPDITTNLEIGKIFKWNVGTMKGGTLNFPTCPKAANAGHVTFGLPKTRDWGL